MKSTPSYRLKSGFRPTTRRTMARRGFTLIEILVVLAVIGILAAILFPALAAAKERANQTSCASNMVQIYQAVRLYFADEKEYPQTLAALLPTTATLNNTTAATAINGQACDTTTGNATSGTCLNARGTGYLKSVGNLVCPSAESPVDNKPWSSYGDVSTGIFPGNSAQTPNAANASPKYDPTKDASGTEMARYVWNYWGYTDDGTGYVNISMGTPLSTEETAYRTNFADKQAYLLPGKIPSPVDVNNVDIYKLPRLANRQAPADTIITHCVYHRIPTASSIANPKELYTAPANDTGAKDIVLRLDGTAKVLDVTTFKGASPSQSSWVLQTFR